MHVPLPTNYLFPPSWQTRIVDIEYLLQPGRALDRRFRAVQELAERLQVDGIAVDTELWRIGTDYPELFPPGEASRRTIRAILCQTPPDRSSGFIDSVRDGFEDEVPAYRSRFPRSGNTRRYRGPRLDREAEDTPAILELLGRGMGAPGRKMPLTYRQIQRKRGMTGRQFHKRLEDLTRRGMRLTPTADRELWVRVCSASVPDSAQPAAHKSPPVTTRCRDCDWSVTGTAAECAAAFKKSFQIESPESSEADQAAAERE
jgi:hypothetical protein